MDRAWPVILAALAGGATAWLHLRLSWQAARASVRHQDRAAALLGMPLRILLVTAALALTAKGGPWPLLAALAAFAVTHRLLLSRWNDPDPEVRP